MPETTPSFVLRKKFVVPRIKPRLSSCKKTPYPLYYISVSHLSNSFMGFSLPKIHLSQTSAISLLTLRLCYNFFYWPLLPLLWMKEPFTGNKISLAPLYPKAYDPSCPEHFKSSIVLYNLEHVGICYYMCHLYDYLYIIISYFHYWNTISTKVITFV